MRDSRVPRPGDHPEQGPQQGRGLVGPRGPHIRDVGRLSALLRRQSIQYLREDPGGQGGVAGEHGASGQGPHQEAAGPGQEQEARGQQVRHGGRQETQVSSWRS